MFKFLRKSLIVCLVSLLVLTSCVSALAAAGQGVNYTSVAGASMTFNKYLVMGAGDRTPAVSFSYTISAGTAKPASNGKMAVLAGVGSPTVSDSVFTVDQATSTSATNDQIDVKRTDRTNVKWDSADGEKFAVSTSTVDFSGVNFTEPGIYRYIITETALAANTAKGIIQDDDTDRVLDVYVTDNGSGVLVVSQYVLHRDESDVIAGSSNGSADVSTAGAALDDKTDGFTNELKTKDLVFKKMVSGNQASRDKFFDFTLSLTGLTAGDKYTVSLVDDNDPNTTDGEHALATSASNDATISDNANKPNPTELTVGSDGSITQHFYLAHDQAIAVRGLPINAGYSVVENAEDYKSTGAGVTGYADAVSGTIGTVAGSNKAVKTSYLNERDGVIPTGIIDNFSVYLLVAMLGIAVIASAIIFSRKKVSKVSE